MTDPDTPSTKFELFKLWKEYEGVAMHFNELIIKLRSQSLGGVAAIATLVGVVAKSDMTGELRWGMLTGTFFLLFVFWIAVWVLDMGYYNRLLQGAVDALLIIEKESKASEYVDRIELSTKIEERTKSHQGLCNLCIFSSRNIFYSLVFLALLAGLSMSAYELYSARSGNQTPTTGTQPTASHVQPMISPAKTSATAGSAP
jgi:hypothetical protein